MPIFDCKKINKSLYLEEQTRCYSTCSYL